MPSVARKSVQIKVSVTPQLHERLREVAAQLGQAPATVASLAIGQWVAQMASTLGAGERAVKAMAAELGPELRSQVAAQAKLSEGKA